MSLVFLQVVQNAMSLYVREMMAEAPKGTPQERMRYLGMSTEQF